MHTARNTVPNNCRIVASLSGFFNDQPFMDLPFTAFT
jgi:hypothetical protein